MPEDTNQNEWQECGSQSSKASAYEYKYEEDPEMMSIKKFKRVKEEGVNGMGVTRMTEAVLYQEEVHYPQKPSEEDLYIPELMEPEYVHPLGYPTEQFLA